MGLFEEIVKTQLGLRFSQASGRSDPQILDQVKADVKRVIGLDDDTISKEVNRYYKQRAENSGTTSGNDLGGSADQDSDDGSEPLSPPPAEIRHPDDPGEQEVKDEKKRNLASDRLAKYLNHVNGNDLFLPQDFLELQTFSANELIRLLESQDFEYNPDVVRQIMRDPSGDRHEEEPRLVLRYLAHRHTIPPPSPHPTRQSPRDHEHFKEIDGKWYVIFEKEVIGSDGKKRIYRQVDELPIFNPDAPAIKIPDNEKDSEIDHPGKLPTFNKYDDGLWELKEETEACGKWRRIYDDQSKHKHRQNTKAEPLFVARKFHRQTKAYLDQYKLGQSWDDWSRNAGKFDINDVQLCRDYNRWIQQVMDRADYRYKKRRVRPCWSREEITALRRHFNDLINSSGVVIAHLFPNWKEAIRKVNEALLARYPDAEPRNENSVSSMAERDSYANDQPSLGTHEWRELGKLLHLLKQKNPTLDFPRNVLFPGRDPIPMDDITAMQAGGHSNPSKKAPGKIKRSEKRIPKLMVKLEDGKIIVTDRFGGKVVKKFGLMDHVPDHVQDDAAGEQDQAGEEQDDGEPDEEDGGQEEGEDEGRQRKKRRTDNGQ